MKQRSMRRDDLALSQQDTLKILEKGEYGILSTVSTEGQPYGVPVSYSLADDRIYFHCAVEGHKLDNLAANKRVSFCVVGDTELQPDKFSTRYESAIIFGQALELAGDEKLAGLTNILKKYSPDFLEKGQQQIESSADKTRVYKIEIETLSGKSQT